MGRKRLLILAAVLIPYLLLVARFDFVCDDAYTLFRYAHNLAQGHGLRFNPGESPPVEGYTDLLWVLWLGALDRLKVPLELGARLSSIACGIALIFLILRFLQQRRIFSTQATLATGLFFALLPPVAVWSTGGLVTMAFALAVFALFESLCGELEQPPEVRIEHYPLHSAAGFPAGEELRLLRLHWNP